jgi:RNA polymerase sigma-70 factor, ECF subfamily
VGVARGGEEAGRAAPADGDDARTGHWPGVGDFDDLVRRYRRELHVYCYRMLGSFDEAEDHVQEVLLRAWRTRQSFQGRSSPRTWLYRVATNACLDTLRRDARRAVAAPASTGPSIAAMPWVQPYPDSLLDELAAGQPGPEAVAVSRETDWAPAAEPDPGQRRLLQRFVAAHEQADPEALIALLRDDIRLAISPPGGEWNGRPDVGDALRGGMNSLGQWRLLPIMANRQPGAAGYLRRPGQTAFVPFALTVLCFEHGRLSDIAAFEQPSMFAAFGLPASL